MEKYEHITEALQRTEVLRFPKQKLATFGITNIRYYIITEPLINELIDNRENDLVIREGKVVAEKPQIITPYYLNNMFSGFEHGQEYTEYVREQYNNNPGLLYKYKNDFKKMEIISEKLEVVVENLQVSLDNSGDPLTTIIKGVNRYWDISLMKFIFDLTTSSLVNNIADLNSRGLLTVDSTGLPRDARVKIENLFDDVKKGRTDPSVLKKELDCWGVFKEYENRFLDLFSKR